MSEVNVESLLVNRIIQDQEIREVLRYKITSDFFFDPDNRELFNWLVREYTAHGSVPSRELAHDTYPDFAQWEVTDSLTSLCESVRNKKLHNDMGDVIEQIRSATLGNPEEGLKLLKEHAASMSAVHTMSHDLDVTKSRQVILNEYQMIKNAEGLLGIPYPWERLNDATLGMHAGEFILLYARPKSLKTWLGLYMMTYAHEQMHKIPVIMTKEMPADQMRRRIVALYCGLDYERYRNGELTLQEEKRFRQDLEAFEAAPPFIVCECAASGMEAVTEFRAKLEEYNADIGFFDGVYLLAEDWKELSKVTRGFKEVSKTLKIPIVGTTQANRGAEKTKGESLSELAYGDSFGQDADVIIRIIRDPQHVENKEVQLTLPGFREGPGCTFTINAIPAQDFTQKAVIDEGDGAISGVDDGVIMPDEEDGAIT